MINTLLNFVHFTLLFNLGVYINKLIKNSDEYYGGTYLK